MAIKSNISPKLAVVSVGLNPCKNPFTFRIIHKSIKYYFPKKGDSLPASPFNHCTHLASFSGLASRVLQQIIIHKEIVTNLTPSGVDGG